MKGGKFYQHAHMPGVYILVNVITKRDNDKIYLKVDWYRRDDVSKRLVNMDTPQDMVIVNDDEKFWIEVSR